MNIIEIENLREIRAIRRAEECYEKYLKTLTTHQLEIEINWLIESDRTPKDLRSKGNLLVKELSLRADPSLRTQIENLTFL